MFPHSTPKSCRIFRRSRVRLRLRGRRLLFFKRSVQPNFHLFPPYLSNADSSGSTSPEGELLVLGPLVCFLAVLHFPPVPLLSVSPEEGNLLSVLCPDRVVAIHHAGLHNEMLL